MQDLNDMQYFACVMKEGGFTAAARVLGVPKSTLSRRVARLEEQLNVRLINRSTRRLVLTDIGREYLRHCEVVIAAAEAAHDTIDHAQQAPRGRVRLTAPMEICRNLLAPVLPEFLAQYPEVSLKLDVVNRSVDLIEEGVDVAVRVRPSIEDSSLVMRRIATSAVLLVAAPALVQRIGKPSSPQGLEHYPSLSMTFADGRPRWKLYDVDGKPTTIKHDPLLVTEDMTVLSEAAIAGTGIVSLPGFICYPAIDAGTLQVLLPDWKFPPGQIHIVYPHRRGLLPAVRALVDFLAKRLPNIAQKLDANSTV